MDEKAIEITEAEKQELIRQINEGVTIAYVIREVDVHSDEAEEAGIECDKLYYVAVSGDISMYVQHVRIFGVVELDVEPIDEAETTFLVSYGAFVSHTNAFTPAEFCAVLHVLQEVA